MVVGGSLSISSESRARTMNRNRTMGRQSRGAQSGRLQPGQLRNTIGRATHRVMQALKKAQVALLAWEKSGQKKRIDAANVTLETYHGSYLYGLVPWTIRVRAALRSGWIGQSLAVVEFVLAVMSVILYVRSTYTTWNPVPLPLLEAIASVYFVADYLMKVYSAPVRHVYMYSLTGIVDVLSALPVMYLFRAKNPQSAEAFIQIFRFLRIIRIFYIIRRLRVITGSVARQFFELFMYTLGIVFVMAGLFQYVERRSGDCPPGVTDGEGCISFYQSFYFIITTILMVGFGDVAPTSELGREVVLLTIFIALTVLPYQISKISDLLARRPYGGAVSSSFVTAERFVILSGSIRFETVRNYLAELYGPVPESENAAFPLRVVIMAPFKPSFELKSMLTVYEDVNFIEGSPLKESDLERVSAKSATAIYLLADKFSQMNSSSKSQGRSAAQDYGLEDFGQMARALSVHQYCGSKVRILVELVNPENRDNAIWDGTSFKHGGRSECIETICTQELRFKLLARSCFVKGLSTLLSNLFISAIDFHPPKKETPPSPEYEYCQGLEQKIYPVLLPEAFIGNSYEQVADLIYWHFSSILIGIDVAGSQKPAPAKGLLIMFPMDYVIEKNDVGIVIAESMEVAQLISAFEVGSYICNCLWDDQGGAGYLFETMLADMPDLVWNDRSSWGCEGTLTSGKRERLGRVCKLDPKRSNPSNWEIKPGERTSKCRGRTGSSSNILSGNGFDDEQEGDWYLLMEDKTTCSLEDVTKKLLTWPPELVGGRPLPEVITHHRQAILENLKAKTLATVQLNNPHILVCCEGHWPNNLYYFVEHLRLEDFPTPPIVILSPEQPGPEQWGCIGIYEDVFYVKGTGTCDLDLLRAGQAECEFLVIIAEDMNADGKPEDDSSLRQASNTLYANDLTNTVVASKAEKGFQAKGKAGVLVELRHNPMFEYLKPFHKIHKVTVRKMSSQEKKRDGLYIFLPSYAMGKAFGADMLDYVLASSFMNKSTVDIFLAFVHDAPCSIPCPRNEGSEEILERISEQNSEVGDGSQREPNLEKQPAGGSSYRENDGGETRCVLDMIHVPSEYIGRQYIDLFRDFLHLRGLLALGLYRAAKKSQLAENSESDKDTQFGEVTGYVFTNPPHDATIRVHDRVYVFTHRTRSRSD